MIDHEGVTAGAREQEPSAGTSAASCATHSLGLELMGRLDQLAQYSETACGLTRTYLTPAHQAAAEQIGAWMRAAGMSVRRDNVGNVIGRYEGRTPGAPALLTGSHFDTVRNAGRYDGALGVVLPIACIARWHAQERRFPFALEVIGFAEEEGVRFNATLLGSRALAGSFDLRVLENTDVSGASMRDVMSACGLNPGEIGAQAYLPAQVLGFVEVHIEQGPVLLDANQPLGVVTAIAGATRFMVEIEGRAGHAGTTPMGMRRDALLAAAEAALYVEQRCSAAPALVGTVGMLSVPAGALNVIPGRAVFSIDIRAEDDAVRAAAIADVLKHLRDSALRRKLQIKLRKVHEADSVPCAPWLQQRLAAAIAGQGLTLQRLPSGAGHDAMALAGLTDVAMLFVRCGNGGISHHPDETMSADDAATAAAVFSRFIENFSACDTAAWSHD